MAKPTKPGRKNPVAKKIRGKSQAHVYKKEANLFDEMKEWNEFCQWKKTKEKEKQRSPSEATDNSHGKINEIEDNSDRSSLLSNFVSEQDSGSGSKIDEALDAVEHSRKSKQIQYIIDQAKSGTSLGKRKRERGKPKIIFVSNRQ